MAVIDESGASAGRMTPPAEVRVWDPLVRIFHWSLVTLFVIAWATGDELDRIHEIAGYIIIGLLVFRVFWGFVGPRHARFSDFVKPPSTIRAYVRDLLHGRARRYLGHNPAGGAMIVALLVMLGVISLTGYLMTTDAFWGIEWVEEAHEAAVNLTLGLIALHIGGVIVGSLMHGENLVRAMITGRKRAPEAGERTLNSED